MRTEKTLIRLADAQVDLSLRWAHMPFRWFCHEAAHIVSRSFCCPSPTPALFGRTLGLYVSVMFHLEKLRADRIVICLLYHDRN